MPRQSMKVSFPDLAVTSSLKSNESVRCSLSCLPSARSSIQFTVAFRFADSHTPSSSGATAKSLVLSQSRIEDADQTTGSRAYKIASNRFERTRSKQRAAQA